MFSGPVRQSTILAPKSVAITTEQAVARSRSAVLVSIAAVVAQVAMGRSSASVASVATKGNAILFAIPTKKLTARLALAARLHTGLVLAFVTRIFARSAKPARLASLVEANGA